MTLKEYWAQAVKWLRSQKLFVEAAHHPDLNDDGLLRTDHEHDAPHPEPDGAVDTSAAESARPAPVQTGVVRAVPPADRQESLEKLQQGFERLIEQLQGINEHLNRQANQHEELMSRIEQLPQMLESFPQVVENQKQITEQLIEQLRGAAAKNERFVDAVEKMPLETAKQTDALVNIDHQLAAAADIDVQMTESFNNFNQALDKLNESTIGHTDGVIQMSKTFAASDRYLKYIMAKQSRRFMWLFIAAISVCVACILLLAGIIIYLNR
jgi:small-conductance mechanosensitive channel